MIKNKIIIEDTTLRDGEQTPSVSFSKNDKLQISRMISDILSEDDSIDAGFPAISEKESETISEICKSIDKNYILGLSRLNKDDIDKAYQSMHYTSKRKIGLIIPTSKIHLKHKLNITFEKLLEMALTCIDYAKQYFEDVEVGLEDASRTDIDSLCEITEKLIDTGVKSITFADTLGYWLPEETKYYIEQIEANVHNISELDYLGVHCHNDLGLALANSLAAFEAGANKIGTSFNGLGERAGNTSTEQVLVLQKVKPFANKNYNIGKYQYDKIWTCSRLVEKLSGIAIQKNSPIIGANCYVHESGIHQNGILKDKSTYQLFDPRIVGYEGDIFYYGKHSGKSGLRYKLQQLGINTEKINMDEYYRKFMDLCDTKKELTEKDFLNIL